MNPPDAKNCLYYGENLEILRSRIKSESVDLCYIDPPFNSNRNYNQIYTTSKRTDQAQAQAFTDTWTWDQAAESEYLNLISNEGGRYSRETIELFKGLLPVLKKTGLLSYLVNIALRMVEINRVLKPNGSFYLHCDPSASHYLKVLADTIFGVRSYKNEITWKRSSAHNDAKQGRKAYGNVADTILFYAKGDDYTFNTQFTPYSDQYVANSYSYTDPDGRRWKSSDLTGPGGAAKGNPRYELLGVVRFWRYSEENMQKLLKEGRIYQSRPGAVPRMKHYLDEMQGVPLQNIWDDIQPVQVNERLGYPTQKPESLIARLIQVSSNLNDVVLDAYCGCGSSIAASQTLGRRWIGIDITYQSVALVLKRLEDAYGPQVLEAILEDGIPRDLEAARALALRKDDKARKEFEKWAVLTYTHNRGIINERRGTDLGIDGFAYIATGQDTTDRIVFQVKSGHVSREHISKLRGDMQRENAAAGVLITLEEPTRAMVQEAARSGTYHHVLTGRTVNKVQIITIRKMLHEKKRLDFPMTMEALRKGPRSAPAKQVGLFGKRA